MKPKTFWLFTILLLFSVSMGYAQPKPDSTITSKIKDIVAIINKNNILDNEHVTATGMKSPQWECFENLQQLASVAELKQLTNNTSAVVRCYAFYALVLKCDSSVFRILLDHLYDNEVIRVRNFDVSWDQKVADYFFYIVPIALSVKQQQEADSVLLYAKKINLDAKLGLLRRLQPNENYYNRIRDILIHEKIPEAGIALARFKKTKDVKRISRLLNKESTKYYGMYAVREFPHPVFYPKLIKIFNKQLNHKPLYMTYNWRILFQALAQYPNQQTVQLFEKAFGIKDNDTGSYLMIAFSRYPNSLFEPLKSKIHLEDYQKEYIGYDMSLDY